MSWEWLVPFARYTEFWRQARKLLDRGLRPGTVAAYRPVQQAKARVLLTRLLATPDDWEAHLEWFVVFTFMRPSLPSKPFPNCLACQESKS